MVLYALGLQPNSLVHYYMKGNQFSIAMKIIFCTCGCVWGGYTWVYVACPCPFSVYWLYQAEHNPSFKIKFIFKIKIHHSYQKL